MNSAAPEETTPESLAAARAEVKEAMEKRRHRERYNAPRGIHAYRERVIGVGKDLRYTIHRDATIYEQKRVGRRNARGEIVGDSRWSPLRRVTDPGIIETVLAMAAEKFPKTAVAP